MKKIVFVVNPVSGIFSKENVNRNILSYLDHDIYKHEIIFTEGPGHATEIASDSVHNGVDIVVAVGGDGSINEVAKGITGSESTLAIIPAGSGNGLAHHLKIPISQRNAIKIINSGKTQRIDTGIINDQVFVSIAGVGFDAIVARKFQKSKLRGFVSYLKIVAEEYSRYKPREYQILVNGQVIKAKALFIVFANSDQFGFNTSIAPSAKINDGLLDIVIAEKPQIIELPFLASLMYWRQIEKSKYISVHKSANLTIKTGKKNWVNIDGEPYKMKKELNIQINPLSLKIIVP